MVVLVNNMGLKGIFCLDRKEVSLDILAMGEINYLMREEEGSEVTKEKGEKEDY